MKKLSNLMLFSAIIFLLFSCNKESNRLKDFYLNQDRSSTLIGKFILVSEANDTDKTIYEFDKNGEHFIYSSENAHAKNIYFWYSSDTTLHTMKYGKSLYKSSEFTYKYWFSDEKDTLFLQSIYEGELSEEIEPFLRD